MPTTVTLRRTTIEEIEIRTDEEPARDVRPGAVIDLAARALESLRGARRIGPRPARRAVDTTAKPVLAIADGRSDR